MQPIHHPFTSPSARPATNWRYASNSTLPATPAPRHLPGVRTTNWRYGTLADSATRPIDSPILIKSFAVNWRYQISAS